MHMSPMVEGEVERAKRKRATVIVTRFEDLFLMPMRGYVSLYVYHESRSFFACESQEMSTLHLFVCLLHFNCVPSSALSITDTNLLLCTIYID